MHLHRPQSSGHGCAAFCARGAGIAWHFHHYMGELCFGAAKSSDPPRAHSLLEQFSSIVAVLPLSAAAGRHYGLVRAALERAGTPIGNNDLWIAAHALALGVPLVSNNLREFERVPGLKLENWV